MILSVTLSDKSGFVDTVLVKDVVDKHCFSYMDNEKNNCEMCIYENGLCLFKECEDHLLELHLHKKNYAKITTPEGVVKLDAKVVDFLLNDDILVMRYIIEDVERTITVKYKN